MCELSLSLTQTQTVHTERALQFSFYNDLLSLNFVLGCFFPVKMSQKHFLIYIRVFKICLRTDVLLLTQPYMSDSSNFYFILFFE